MLYNKRREQGERDISRRNPILTTVAKKISQTKQISATGFYIFS